AASAEDLHSRGRQLQLGADPLDRPRCHARDLRHDRPPRHRPGGRRGPPPARRRPRREHRCRDGCRVLPGPSREPGRGGCRRGHDHHGWTGGHPSRHRHPSSLWHRANRRGHGRTGRPCTGTPQHPRHGRPRHGDGGGLPRRLAPQPDQPDGAPRPGRERVDSDQDRRPLPRGLRRPAGARRDHERRSERGRSHRRRGQPPDLAARRPGRRARRHRRAPRPPRRRRDDPAQAGRRRPHAAVPRPLAGQAGPPRRLRLPPRRRRPTLGRVLPLRPAGRSWPLVRRAPDHGRPPGHDKRDGEGAGASLGRRDRPASPRTVRGGGGGHRRGDRVWQRPPGRRQPAQRRPDRQHPAWCRRGDNGHDWADRSPWHRRRRPSTGSPGDRPPPRAKPGADRRGRPHRRPCPRSPGTPERSPHPRPGHSPPAARRAAGRPPVPPSTVLLM
ncbi:MAG: GH4, partial [uncultured Thermomicrobiales bacterium]